MPKHGKKYRELASQIDRSKLYSPKAAMELVKELAAAKARGALSLIEVKCQVGAREDLGRPTTTALENKNNFMEYING